MSVLNSQCLLNEVLPMLSLRPISSFGGEGFRAGAGLAPLSGVGQLILLQPARYNSFTN